MLESGKNIKESLPAYLLRRRNGTNIVRVFGQGDPSVSKPRWHDIFPQNSAALQRRAIPQPTFHATQDSSRIDSIDQALLAAAARGIAAEHGILFLPQANQDKLVIAASEGMDDSYSMSLQTRSPSLSSGSRSNTGLWQLRRYIPYLNGMESLSLNRRHSQHWAARCSLLFGPGARAMRF